MPRTSVVLPTPGPPVMTSTLLARRLADGVALGRGQFQAHLLLDPAAAPRRCRWPAADGRPRAARAATRATPSSARNSGLRYSHGSSPSGSRTTSPACRSCLDGAASTIVAAMPRQLRGLARSRRPRDSRRGPPGSAAAGRKRRAARARSGECAVDAEPLGQLVGRLEADAPDVGGQAIRDWPAPARRPGRRRSCRCGRPGPCRRRATAGRP